MNLRYAVMWMMASRLFYTFCQWLMLLAVIQLTDLNTAGMYGLALAVTTIVFRFTEFGISQAVTTDSTREYPDQQYHHLRLILSTFALVVVVFFALCVYGFSSASSIIAAMLVPKFAEAHTTLTYGFWRRANRIGWIAISLIARGLLGCLIMTLTLWSSGSLAFALVLLGGCWWAIYAFGEVNVQRLEFGRRVQGRIWVATWGQLLELWPLAACLAPLGLAGALTYATGALPTIILERTNTIEAVGVYTALFYPFQAGNMVITSLGEAILQPLANALRNDQWMRARRVAFGAATVVVMCIVLGLGVVHFAGGWLLSAVYGAELALYSYEFTCMAIVWCVRYVASTVKLLSVALRQFKAAFWMHCIAFLPMLLVAPWLIDAQGLLGAIFSVGLSHALFLGTAVYAAYFSIVALRRTRIEGVMSH